MYLISFLTRTPKCNKLMNIATTLQGSICISIFQSKKLEQSTICPRTYTVPLELDETLGLHVLSTRAKQPAQRTVWPLATPA